MQPPFAPCSGCRPGHETSPDGIGFRYARIISRGKAGRHCRFGRPRSGRETGMKALPLRQEVQVESGHATARAAAPAMIEIDRVSHRFQASGRRSHLALSEISLSIEDGAFVSILGPSGCGKSTLLYIVGGFVNPTHGVAK